MEQNKPKKKLFGKWSSTSMYHYYKLIFRSLLLIAAVVSYILSRVYHIELFSFKLYKNITPVVLLWVIWAVYIVEMFLRMFPSRIESMGCQKLFGANFKLRGSLKKLTAKMKQDIREHMHGNFQDLLIGRRSHGRVAVVVVWCILNGIIAILYFNGIIDQGILMIISLFYSVCDMICILFFCPFQTWFMKNRCCCNCYIYNWDYGMMFTPLLFIPHFYTWSLVGLAIIVLIQWELTIRLYPERFDSRTNEMLQCKNCTEKLCRHKKQLQGFIRVLEKNTHVENIEVINMILGQKNKFDNEE